MWGWDACVARVPVHLTGILRKHDYLPTPRATGHLALHLTSRLRLMPIGRPSWSPYQIPSSEEGVSNCGGRDRNDALVALGSLHARIVGRKDSTRSFCLIRVSSVRNNQRVSLVYTLAQLRGYLLRHPQVNKGSDEPIQSGYCDCPGSGKSRARKKDAQDRTCDNQQANRGKEQSP